MEFASSYVYRYDNSDEEYISDEEYEAGMQLSDSDDGELRDASAELAAVTDTSVGASAASKGGGMFETFKEKFRFRSKGNVPKSKCKQKKKLSHWRSAKSNEASTSKPPAPPGSRKWRRADTNVISVTFEKLTEPGNMHTGDPLFCSHCQAVFSHLSKITKREDKQIWKCEFCSSRNDVDLTDEEIPRHDDITFMLEPALATTASGHMGIDKSLVIFCVDTSGSMCVTTEVPGRVQLRGSYLDRLQSLNEEGEDQYLPRQNRNVTYISRLQGMQAAVDHQLAEMQKNNPDRRVALVTFNNEVTVVGDGSELPVHITGDRLTDKDELIKLGKEMMLAKPIKETRKKLGSKVFDLEEGGATALGPALLLSIAMASQVPGSKVIICTDGKANVGLGSMDTTPDDGRSIEEQQKAVTDYYAELSTLAADEGVCVSVISIKGTDCKLVELGQVADVTGGQVNIVDPLKLTQEFGTILADEVIATKVTATMLLHKQLYFRHENNAVGNRVVRNVGNVTKETEITFEYGVRSFPKKKKMKTSPALLEGQEGTSKTEDAAQASGSTDAATAAVSSCSDDDNEQLTQLPFQLQIVYTDTEGAKAMRLLTQSKPVTQDRSMAEKNLNIAVLGSHTAQQSANLAKKGEYTKARLTSLMGQRLVARNAWQEPTRRGEYRNFYDNIAPVEQQLNQQQQIEKQVKGRSYSDDEEEEDEDNIYADDTVPSFAKSAPKKKMMARRGECSDNMAQQLYFNSNISSKHFKK